MDRRRIVLVLVVALGLSGCVTKESYNAQVLRTNNFQRLLSEEEKRSVELSSEIAKLKDEKTTLEAKNKALAVQLNEANAKVVRSLEEAGRFSSSPSLAPVPTLRLPSQEPPDRLGELQESNPILRDVEKKFEKKKVKPAAQAKALKPSPPSRPEPPAPVLQAPSSQEPPDRLGELQDAPAARSEKKIESKTGKATAQVRMQKPSKVPPPEPEVVLPPPAQASPPPPAKLQARPPAQPEAARPDTSASDSFFRYHQVKKGETLDAIAKRYKTDAQTLRELNDLGSGDSVRPGDRIIVGQK